MCLIQIIGGINTMINILITWQTDEELPFSRIHLANEHLDLKFLVSVEMGEVCFSEILVAVCFGGWSDVTLVWDFFELESFGEISGTWFYQEDLEWVTFEGLNQQYGMKQPDFVQYLVH